MKLTIGEQIHQARKLKGWTMEQLGTRAGASRNFISTIERNEGRPTLKMLESIAEALGCELDITLEVTK
jgi:transcriptional regulator with XRE-family HTH domain